MLDTLPRVLNNARRYFVGTVPGLDALPAALVTVSTNYCLFLAIDASSINDEALRQTAKSLLERGLAYFCVWGPDCERVHDQLDSHRLPKEPKNQVVMTTWHTEESIAEALSFFVNCTVPDTGFEADCTDWVAVTVMNETWAQQIRTYIIEATTTEK